MAEEKKFNPAPPDKHADDPKQARKADKEMHDALDKGLEGTFPASDPVSSTQPAKSKRTPIRRKGSANRRTMLGSRFSRVADRAGFVDFFAGQADVGGRRFPGVPLGTPGPLRSAFPLLATSPRSCAASYSSARRRFAAASRRSRRRQRQS